jgi:hypothetical protein
MQTQVHPLETFFQHEVRTVFEGKLGLNDPLATDYVVRVLCKFAETESLFVDRGPGGHSMQDLQEMVRASDPVLGTAISFDAERVVRKYMGDYTLFVAGMFPEAVESGVNGGPPRPTLGELIKIGKESYYIVSQFNVFEHKKEAPLFGRLSDHFERYLLGLALVRRELSKRTSLPS